MLFHNYENAICNEDYAAIETMLDMPNIRPELLLLTAMHHNKEGIVSHLLGVSKVQEAYDSFLERKKQAEIDPVTEEITLDDMKKINHFVYKNDLNALEQLLKQEKFQKIITYIFGLSIAWERKDIITFILKLDKNYTEADYIQLVREAVISGCYDLIELLLEKDTLQAALRKENKDHFTKMLLFTAIGKGQTNIMMKLFLIVSELQNDNSMILFVPQLFPIVDEVPNLSLIRNLGAAFLQWEDKNAHSNYWTWFPHDRMRDLVDTSFSKEKVETMRPLIAFYTQILRKKQAEAESLLIEKMNVMDPSSCK